MTDESWRTYSDALRQLLQRPLLLSQFQEDMNGSTAADLNITPDMSTDLKKLILLLPPSQPEEASIGALGVKDDEVEKSVMSAEDFFRKSYTNLRRGAITTTIMSILIFLMGLFLLAIAAAQSIQGSQPGTTIVLAASGIVAIAAAFYRSPVEQIRESAGDMQRASMVLMSYMLGLSLLSKSLTGQRTAEESEMLTALTRDLIDLLPGNDRAGKATYESRTKRRPAAPRGGEGGPGLDR